MMLEEWLRQSETESSEGEGKKTWRLWRRGKGSWLIVAVAALGILVMVWPWSSSPPSVAERAAESDSGGGEQVRGNLAKELESILSQVEGAGQVEVSLTLGSAGERVYARNEREDVRHTEETDRNGGERNTEENSRQSDVALANGSPLLLEEKAPVITGVLVLADGADDVRMQEILTDLTASLLNLSPHQVRVAARRGNDS